MSTSTLAPRIRHAAPAAAPAGELRLTRRGRLLVLTLALLAVLAVGVWLATGAVGTDASGTQTPTETVVVGPGDTLWDIAADASDDGDVAAMMSEISDLNALDSSMLVSGQHLRVPTS